MKKIKYSLDYLDFKMPIITENFSKLICGDLHGNFRKLLDFFILSEFLEINQEEYFKLIKQFDMKNFNLDVLETIRFRESSKELILLGDVFGDRNPEDCLKMQLIDKLNRTTNNKLTILYGNHDNAAFNILKGLSPDCTPCLSDFKKLHHFQKKSILNIFKTILNKNYSLVYLVDNIFLSHTPIRLDTLNKFNISSNGNIEEVVKNINIYFKDFLNGKNDKNDILNLLIWDRFNPLAEYISKEYNIEKQICGHDSFEEMHNVITLDNLNGKSSGLSDVEQLIIL